MSTKKSLYDILEVSPVASQETIRAAFDRLTAKFDDGTLRPAPGLDVQAQYNLIKEAYSTLGNPSRREAYDLRLQGPVLAPAAPNIDAEQINKPLLSGRTKAIVMLVLLGLGYYTYASIRNAAQERNAALEAQRLLIQEAKERQKQIEAKADADSANARAIYEDQKREREERAERERAERERDRAISEADNTSRRLQAAEDNRRRDEERKSRELQSQARDQQRQDDYRRQEEARRAEQERQRVIEAARRSTPDRPKGVSIPPANPF
ncbi:DnaJ domain-containing protein [Uliginosibacterium sp. H3]|uniref:DnaJ domain-containing protein n=1 Tax=Uliginosibacterium silvisoli TaxID=3114758 RepID=A0ABU6K294_9RHOO|nr:DnaJ domain-containing protein [Uliginosibacterium sp. H3]